MSGSRMFFDGRRQPGRSNFVQTCNLLSRYIKEKGSLRDLNLEIGGKVESVEAIVRPGSKTQSSATMSNILTNKPPISSMSKDNPKPSQLTIFYSGRVLVFDDYPAEMAKELMAFAKKEGSQMSCGVVGEKPSPSTAVAPVPVSSSRDGLPPRPQASTGSNTCKEKTSSPTGTTSGAGQNSAYPEANGSDLPIARRSSLHRFLEKRKDRAAARGPYHQVQEQPAAGSYSKGDEQLELKL